MTRPTIQMLTGFTISAAVVSALLLSAGDAALPDSTHLLCANTMLRSDLPAAHDAGVPPSPLAPATAPSQPAALDKLAA